MIRNHASPVISVLFFIYFIGGPIFIVLQGDIITAGPSPSIRTFAKDTALTMFFPADLLILGITIAILYSVRYVEFLSGSIRVLVSILFVFLVDFVSRCLSFYAFGRQINSSGPMSVISFLLVEYSILFPNVKSPFINRSEKLTLMFLLIVVVIITSLGAIAPILIGFALGLLLYPFIKPRP